MTEDGKGAKLSMGFNGSYIKTDVKLRKDLGYLSFTNEKSELEGQRR
jgi:hypothetical protein